MIEWKQVKDWDLIEDGLLVLIYTESCIYETGAKWGDFVNASENDIYPKEEITYFQFLTPPDEEE